MLAKHTPEDFSDDRIISNIFFFSWDRIILPWLKIVSKILEILMDTRGENCHVKTTSHFLFLK